jgi:hypothetical protein
MLVNVKIKGITPLILNNCRLFDEANKYNWLKRYELDLRVINNKHSDVCKSYKVFK